LLREQKIYSLDPDRDVTLQREISDELKETTAQPLEEVTRELTGIEIIDHIVPSGIPSPVMRLIMGDLGTAKRELCLEFVANCLTRYFTVPKMRGTSHHSAWRAYELDFKTHAKTAWAKRQPRSSEQGPLATLGRRAQSGYCRHHSPRGLQKLLNRETNAMTTQHFNDICDKPWYSECR